MNGRRSGVFRRRLVAGFRGSLGRCRVLVDKHERAADRTVFGVALRGGVLRDQKIVGVDFNLHVRRINRAHRDAHFIIVAVESIAAGVDEIIQV